MKHEKESDNIEEAEEAVRNYVPPPPYGEFNNSNAELQFGNYLHCKVPIRMTLAVLGGEIDVQSIDGAKIKVKVPESTQTGTKLRCKEKGMPHMNSHVRGDFYVEEKLKEFRLEGTVPVKEVDINGSTNWGPFTVEFINITHSIPEANSILISTEMGSSLHTGDWKFDPKPVVGLTSNIERLKEIGDKGYLLAAICDSTNILSKQNPESEVLLGRSLWRIVKVAQDSGYLTDSPQFLEAKEAVNFPRERLVLLCTGCQGEPLAATSRLANKNHQAFKMQQGDTMIFSSKIIPGNETRAHNMLNAFIEMGVEVVTEKTEHVHASGHPTREELKEMYSLIKPKMSIPVHGEYIHTHANVKFAKECGVAKAIMIAPGDIVNLENGEKVDSISVDYFGIDGILLPHPESSVIKMRKRMRDAGVIVVIAVVNKKNKLLTKPKVFVPGVFELLEDAAIIQKIVKKVESLFSLQPTKKIKNKIESSILSILKEYLLKRPIIEVQIEQV
ncbi:unnamed protein product [Parnassius apollo]|uniref:(apollo) hypothetical protein n=1 Tax=Parnassius apollo TaxID=110799 RepID=A0A8S3Y8Q3_PARAO|nr:unnamed protein product [Parnassius apollo]